MRRAKRASWIVLAFLLPELSARTEGTNAAPDWPVGTRILLEGKLTGTAQLPGAAGESDASSTIAGQILVVGKEADGRMRLIWAIGPVESRSLGEEPEPGVALLLRDADRYRFVISPEELPLLGISGWSAMQKWLPPYPVVAPEKFAAPGSWQETRPFAFWGRGKPLARLTRVEGVEGRPSERKLTVESARKLPLMLFEPEAGTPNQGVYLVAYSETWRLDLPTGRLLGYERLHAISFGSGKAESGTRDLKLELREVSRERLAGERLAALEKALNDVRVGESQLGGGSVGAEEKRERLEKLRPRFEAAGLANHVPAIASRIEAEEKQRREANRASELVGQEAPDFSLDDLEGKKVSLSGLRGKVVLLVFWGVG